MEIAGVAIGAAGLLTLYGLFQDAVSKVHSIKDFSSESSRLVHRYNANKILFERWGNHVGITSNNALEKSVHPELKDTATASTIAGLLKSIHDVFTSADPALARYHPESPGLHMKSRLKWAVADSGKLSRQLLEFDDLVQKLYLLVPPERPGRDEFQKLQETLIQSQHTQALNQISHWLDATTTEDTLDAYSTMRLDTTCNWVLTHSTYKDWLSDPLNRLSKILWIHGPAGFGKSVLCAYIVKSLSNIGKFSVSYFFCSGDNESQRNPTSILRSWILQGVQQDDAISDLALQYIGSHETAKAIQSDLWELLKKIMSHNSNRIFVVDGLDECPRMSTARVDLHRNREDTLRELIKIAAITKSRLLVVSREEGDIISQLRPHGPHPTGIEFYELGITKDHVALDVSRFAEHVVTQKLPGKSDEFHQGLAAQMAGKSDGMFLWIRLQSRNLRPRKGKSQLQRIINEMPTDIARIYERDWKDIQSFSSSDRQRAEAIMRWVTFAQRPLTITELSEVVAVLDNGENDGPDFDELPDPFDKGYVDDEIIGLCGSFLQLRATNDDEGLGSQTVHLVHFTANEFLSGVHDGVLFSDYLLQHHYLAQQCLRYLDHDDTWQFTQQEDSESISNRPFLAYAAFRWYEHLEASESFQSDLKLQLESFFGATNRNWDEWRDLFEISQEHDSDASDVDDDSDGENSDDEGSDELDKNDRTPLESEPGERMYYAAMFGLYDVMQYLYSSGITDIDMTGGFYGNPIQAATRRGNLAALTFLLEMGADVHYCCRFGGPLHAAILRQDDAKVMRLLQYGAPVSSVDDKGNTPLCIAIKIDYYEGAQFLIDRNADLSIPDLVGRAPIHLAASSGNTQMVKLLLQHGADLAATDTYKWTPLLYAAGSGHSEVVRTLLDCGADPAALTKHGNTPLHLAACNGYHEAIKVLLHSGADPAASTKYGKTPLHFAAAEGHAEVLTILLDSGADPGTLNGERDNPLHLAAYYGHSRVIQTLLKAGVDPMVLDDEGYTALYLASRRGHFEAAKVLLDSGVDNSQSDPSGWTPLHWASFNGDLEVVQLLLNTRADVDHPAWDGCTPLHLAFEFGHEKVIWVLLQSQASLNCLDSYGKAPWQYSNANFQKLIPECKDCVDPPEVDRQQRIRQSVQTIAGMAVPMKKKDIGYLITLGRCLFLLQDSQSASVVLNQTIKINPESGGVISDRCCSKCNLDLSREQYACATCPNMDLCSSCMPWYTANGSYKFCAGHEFLRIPSEDWNPEEVTDVYTEEFVGWLKDLALRYQLASL